MTTPIESSIENQMLVSTFELQPFVWDKPIEEFKEALAFEIDRAKIDLLEYAVELYNERKESNGSSPSSI